MNEDDLSFVYVSLCEIQDALLRRLFQRQHPIGWHVHVINQFLCGGISVLSVQHAGGDISFFSSKNL